MPRRRRAGEKLPPSGKMSSASASPRLAASAAISPSVSPPRGSTKRLGRRWPRMSNSGSRRSASCSTTRGRRRWRTSSSCRTSSESPSPACRLSTMSGPRSEDSARSASAGVRPAHVDARQPRHRAMDARDEPAHEAVVRAHHPRRSDVAPEAAGHPQPTAGGGAGEVPDRVVGGDRDDAHSARSGDERRRRARRSAPAGATRRRPRPRRAARAAPRRGDGRGTGPRSSRGGRVRSPCSSR